MKIEKRFKSTKTKKKDGPLIEFIILGSGKNIHKTVPYSKDAKFSTKTSEIKKYTINPDNLLISKPMFGKKKLVAIFRKDGTAVIVKRSDSKITAEILDLANRSTALGRTIKEMFTTHLNIKKVLFFVIIGVVGVVAFLILSGGIRI